MSAVGIEKALHLRSFLLYTLCAKEAEVLLAIFPCTICHILISSFIIHLSGAVIL